MPIICVIEFDNNPHGVFFAGQVVTGRVVLQTDEAKNANALVLKISGFAHTHWTEGSGKSKSTYTGHEDYLKSITYLMGSNEKILFKIEPGTYSYNFSCLIPKECPSSFEGLYGQIRYTVAVSIVRPWKFDNTFTRNFSVAKVLDLNYDNPLLYHPVTAQASTTFGLGPFKEPGRLSINASMPQSGYIPGQTMPIDVLISNECDILVKELKISLVMHIRHYCHYTSRTKLQEIKVIKHKGEGVQCYCTKNFHYKLLIPATPPTCLHLCRIIKITYELKVEAKVKGWHTNPVVCLPVTIGNIPPSTILLQPISYQDVLSEFLAEACSVNNGSSTVDQKSVHLNAEAEGCEDTNAIPLNNITANVHYTNNSPPCWSVAEQKFAESLGLEVAATALSPEVTFNVQNSRRTPPPTFEEAIDQESVHFRAEACNLEDSIGRAESIENTVVTTEGHLDHTTFEEAMHMTHANITKNVFAPRYPVFRHMFSSSESDVLERNPEEIKKTKYLNP